jgi:diguanylate cyclase (GGDEF)-like protein/PAS domain S-box-containing protein
MYAEVVETGQPLVLDDFVYPHEILAEPRRFDIRGVKVGDAISFTWRDVTDRHEAAARLAASEERFRTAMTSAPVGMGVVSLDRRFEEVNPALCRMLQREEEWLLSHDMAELLDEPCDAIDRSMRARLLDCADDRVVDEHRMVRADGQRIWVQHTIGLVRDRVGEPASFVSLFVDITETRRDRERLEFLATHDALTGLLNRRALHEVLLVRLAPTVPVPAESGGPAEGTGASSMAVMFIDLDGLKVINDTHGHAGGDAVIAAVAERLRDVLGEGVALARLGGDEFVAALPRVVGRLGAEAAADSIQRRVARPVHFASTPIDVALSIGLTFAEPGEDVDAVLRRADAALYRAKQAGRGRTALYP